MTNREPGILHNALAGTFATFEKAMDAMRGELRTQEVGRIQSLGRGVARVDGLPNVRMEELLLFPGRRMGLAFNLDVGEIGVILLDDAEELTAGAEVLRTERVLDVPVGENLLGRVVDGLGRPLDGQGPVHTSHRFPVEREAPPIMHRAPVTVPLQTGLKVVDTLIPIGRGQRQLILGDRQTGKTAVALDTLLNQSDTGVVCIYCAVGQRASAVAKLIADLKARDALAYSLIVVATEDDPPGLQHVTPYAAMSMGEYFMEHGRDVLVILDDLTRHARAYRELSLLLRRPPGREAFPGDVFYIHSRLLERSTHLRREHGGGSLTAMAICETEAQNLSAYIPTNLISITDGQIYTSPDLFQKGVLPAVDVGKSVSRVGGKTQLAAYRGLAGELRLAYAQFAELEAFARFGTRLDPDIRRALERGRRVREILKQNQYQPRSVFEQIAMLIAVTSGLLDTLPVEDLAKVENGICRVVSEHSADVGERIVANEKLQQADLEAIRAVIQTVVEE